jgi:hypothetical protein
MVLRELSEKQISEVKAATSRADDKISLLSVMREKEK